MNISAFSLEEVESMELKEIDKRIRVINKLSSAKKKVELKSFMSILHLAISAGNNPSRKNNKIFYKELDKIFGDNVKDEQEISPEDLMKFMNGK